MLTSQEQVAAYMSGQLSVDTIGHCPTEPDNQTQGRDQLTEINQQLAPTITVASRQASASRDPIVESRAATTETQGEMSYGGASKLGPAVDAAGGSTKAKAAKKYKSRQELVEENVMLKTQLLEMQIKCEALEENETQIGHHY